MDEAKVELVARAMHDSHVARREALGRWPVPPWSEVAPEMRVDYCIAARAGIAAYLAEQPATQVPEFSGDAPEALQRIMVAGYARATQAVAWTLDEADDLRDYLLDAGSCNDGVPSSEALLTAMQVLAKHASAQCRRFR